MKVLALIGPTATGKSNLAIELAKKYPMEIISMDSALVYKEMNIGTSKPSKEIRTEINHYLIDILEPTENYNAANFINDCKLLINNINKKDKIALITGGTMMYYNSLINGLSVLPSSDKYIRAQITKQKEKYGIKFLYEQLIKIDEPSANQIKPNDTQRIERALEIFMITNKPMSLLKKEKFINGINVPTIALFPSNDRELLHLTIKNRFLGMIKQGFIDEVKYLRDKYPSLNNKSTSMRSVGYRQALDYLDNIIDKETFINNAIFATRQLAKRQITWIKKFDVILKLDPFINNNKIQIIEPLISNLI